MKFKLPIKVTMLKKYFFFYFKPSDIVLIMIINVHCLQFNINFSSTSHGAGGCKQIQIHTDSHWFIDFLRLQVMFTLFNVRYCNEHDKLHAQVS